MNRNIALILTLAVGILAAPLAADAQQGGKVYRIGYVGGAGRAAGAYLFDAFQQGLRERGYIEGQNVIIESRYADGKFERLPALVAERGGKVMGYKLALTTYDNNTFMKVWIAP